MRKKKNKFMRKVRDMLYVILFIIAFILLIPWIIVFILIILFCKIFIPKADILNDYFEDLKPHGK